MRRAGYGEELVQRIDRLSRISPEELGEPAGTAAIYRLLLQIPARITTHELVAQFPSLRVRPPPGLRACACAVVGVRCVRVANACRAP